MNKKDIIILTPTEGPLDKALEDLSKQEDFNIIKVGIDEITPEDVISRVPTVVLTSSEKVAVTYLTLYSKIMVESSSKFLVIVPKEVSKKFNRMTSAFKIDDIIVGETTNTKTIIYKANLLQKSLPELDEKAKENMDFKIKSLAPRVKEKDQKVSKEEEIETVDFQALNKFCDKAMRRINELEELLDNFEESLVKSSLNDVPGIFTGFKVEAEEQNLGALSLFCDIPLKIIDKTKAITDEAFLGVLAGILLNSLDLLRTEIQQVKNKMGRRPILDSPHATLFKRFFWLSDKFEQMDGDNGLVDILNQLGIQMKKEDEK